MAAIALGAPLVWFAVVRLGVGAPRPGAIGLALLITLVPQWLRPPSPNVHQTAFYPWSVALGIAAVVLVLLSLWSAAARVRPGLLFAALAAMVVAIIITVPGGTHPMIDVWDIFQQSAAVVFHGVNPYEITSFDVPAKQTANCFNYLPASFLVSWIGWISGGDVRYAEAAVLLAGWLALGGLLLRRAQSERIRLQALTMVLVAMTLAGSLRVAQQAWNESLILGFLLLGAALLLTRYAGWAWVGFALALATKQHVALLLPLFAAWPGIGWRRAGYSALGGLAICAPWVVWNFDRFKTCTVDFFLTIPARQDSISLWRFLPHGLQNIAVLAGLLIGYLLALRYLPRTVGGLLIGCGLVLMGFDLSNKQTFENQWWLCAELIVCGLAVRVIETAAKPEVADAVDRPAATR
ncbi:MAG: hypothetical protein QOK10_1909 [Pseudonocardiales bacterium]|jgi:hypothetical protein|nr:hypothetical protein [Pseudonocardiales bacterium]